MENVKEENHWYFNFGERGMNYTRFYLTLKLVLD